MEPMDPALDALLRESGWLARLARALSSDPHRAEEAVQETLVAALEHPGEARSLRGWLRAVLRSKLASQQRADVRRGRRERARGETRPVPEPGDVHARLELQELVVEAVRALDEPYRATIVARYLDELSPAAIARRDGVPVRTVHTRLTRGLARLRERLAGRIGTERLQAWMLWLGAPGLRGAGVGSAATAVTTKSWIGGALMHTTTKLTLAAAGLAGLVWLAVGETQDGVRRDPREPAAGTASATQATAANASAELAAIAGPGTGRSEPPARIGTRSSLEAEAPVVQRSPRATEGELRVVVRRQSDGLPLEHAVVAALPRGAADVAPEPIARVRTGAGGTGVLRLPAAHAFLVSCEVPSDPWHPIQQITLEVPALAAGEVRSIDVELPDGYDRTFHGRVVAAEDGRPLPEAELLRHPIRGAAPEVDGHGAFAVPYASWTPDELEVRCAGYASVRVSVERVDQSASEPYVVALERAGAVEAHLASDVDPASTLRLRAKDGREWDQGFDEGREAVLEGLPVRLAFTVELRAEGRTVWRDPGPLVLAPGERRVLEIAPGAGCLLFGTLLDENGVPIADHGVVAFPANDREGFDEGGRLAIGGRSDPGMVQAALDGHGGYEFLSLPEGRWWVGPAFEGELAAWAVGVVIGPGSHARRLDLVAERGRWIRGVVVGPDGEPVRGGHVLAQPTEDRGQFSVAANDGRFAIGPLRSGAYALRALAQGAFGWGKPLVVEAGTEDVVLRLAGDGSQGTIAGRVVDEAGRGVKSHVHLLMPRRGSIGTSTTDEGTFLLTGIDPGEYSVTASMPDGRAVVVPVTMTRGETREGLVLELAPGGRIAVTHDLEDGVRVAIWVGQALAADSTVRPGEETFEVVPAGRVRVELYGGGRTLAEQTVLVRPGRVERADFDVR